jgi:hypothetical protein
MEPTAAERVLYCKFEGVLLLSVFGSSDGRGAGRGTDDDALTIFFRRGGGREETRREKKKKESCAGWKKNRGRKKRKERERMAAAEEFPTRSLDLCATCTAKRRIPPSFYSTSLPSTPFPRYTIA